MVVERSSSIHINSYALALQAVDVGRHADFLRSLCSGRQMLIGWEKSGRRQTWLGKCFYRLEGTGLTLACRMPTTWLEASCGPNGAPGSLLASCEKGELRRGRDVHQLDIGYPSP